MFERVIELFDEYYRLADAMGIGLNRPAGVEVRRRLQQLDWLLSQVRTREEEAKAILDRAGDAIQRHLAELRAAGLGWEDSPAGTSLIDRDSARRSSVLGFEIELLTESFYYLAERVRTIMKLDKPALLPEIGDPGFLGVSRVRNKILEHYLPDGRLVAVGFGHGGAQGPVLQAVEQAGIEQESDAGLYANATEFAGVLERRIGAALGRLIASSRGDLAR